MTSVELDQFLIDHHLVGDVIEVDSNWLQQQLVSKLAMEREEKYYTARAEAFKARIAVLEDKLELYKELLKIYKNRKVLNVWV